MKTRFLFCVAALLGAVLIHAQEETITKKWRFGLFASPDLSFRSLAGNTGTSAQIAGTRNRIETPKTAFTAGGEVLYRHSEKWSFTGGIQFSVKGDKTDVLTLTYSADPRTGFASVPAGEPNTVQLIYNSRYIDLPLRVDYYFSRKRIAPFISAGVSTNIFLNERTVVVKGYEDGSKKRSGNTAQNGYHRVNPQVQLGGGIDVVLPTGILRVLPLARMSVLPVNSGSVDGYFYSVGLGLNYFL
ncbi:MAG: PorT family protein [Bacteroidetes bacterium]|nr:PorT family protein [Bacteroidota bacterium]